MESNPVVWFEIYVQDMDRAKSFYENVFDCALIRLENSDPEIEMWRFPMYEEATGTCGALVQMKDVTPGTTGTIVYFSSENCAVETARVIDAGGIIQQEKMPIGEYGFVSLIIDTEGNMVGIHSNI